MWKLNRSVSTNVIGAIDVCLWDINGKLAGQPIHRLLGTCKDSVPADFGAWLRHAAGNSYTVCIGILHGLTTRPHRHHGSVRLSENPLRDPHPDRFPCATVDRVTNSAGITARLGCVLLLVTID